MRDTVYFTLPINAMNNCKIKILGVVAEDFFIIDRLVLQLYVLPVGQLLFHVYIH